MSLSAIGCPICLGVMRHPEILPNCGHSFCAACIEALPAEISEEKGSFVAACPLCRVPFMLGSSVPNWSLREILPEDPVLVEAIREAAEPRMETQAAEEDPTVDDEPVELEAPSEEEPAASPQNPVDVGAALMECRRLVGDPAFVALTTAFARKHCAAFDETSEENKLEHTDLHEQFVALVEGELVGGLHTRFGAAFQMAPFLAAVPAFVDAHGGGEKSEALLCKDCAEDEPAATLPETLAVLNRFSSFVDFKADMLATKLRLAKQAAAQAAGANQYFAVMGKRR